MWHLLEGVSLEKNRSRIYVRSCTVDGRNPANQLRLVVYPIIYKVLYIPGGDRRISEPSTVGIFPHFVFSGEFYG